VSNLAVTELASPKGQRPSNSPPPKNRLERILESLSGFLEQIASTVVNRRRNIFKRIVAAIGAILTLFAGIYADEIKAWLKKHYPEMGGVFAVGLTIAKVLVLLSLVAAFLVAIWKWHILEKALADERAKTKAQTDRIAQLEGERDAATKSAGEPPAKKESIGRWDTIRTIRYGHIDYPPFLRHNNITGDPTGPAVELLTQLLTPALNSVPIRVEARGGRRNWDNVFEGLTNGDYDVVATPLFATSERSKKVRFTAPLFYSNIGLYVRQEIPLEELKIDGLARAIKAFKLDFFSIDGEISQRLAGKYAPPERIREPDRADTALSDLFERVADPEDGMSALFCESYYAHHQKLVEEGKVKNALAQYEILYPVCFAVRIGDYQLANLLNIRLLQMAQETGILKQLVELLPSDPDNKVKEEEIDLHFVYKWPTKVGDRAHA
jgi:hypothetical protein